MLNAIAQRYGMLVSHAARPARRIAGLRGHMRDWRQQKRRGHHMRMAQMAILSSPESEQFREMAMGFSLIALAARLSVAGGKSPESGLALFSDLFPLPGQEQDKLPALFALAVADAADALAHARRIAALFPPQTHGDRLRDLLRRLVKLASSEGKPNDAQMQLLRRVGEAFSLRARELSQLLHGRTLPATVGNPYALLQAKRHWNDRQIRHAYLRLSREYHPDHVQAKGGTPKAVQQAGQQMALLNAAYAMICEERALR